MPIGGGGDGAAAGEVGEGKVAVLRDLVFRDGHFIELLDDGTEVKHTEAGQVEFEDHSSKAEVPTTLEDALKRIEELQSSERTLKRQVDEMAQEIRE